MRTRKLKSRAGGFTLIEVLVVVAIIALLIAILIPSLRRARDQGKAVMCGSNLKQTFTALFMYTDEFKGTLPPLPDRLDSSGPVRV